MINPTGCHSKLPLIYNYFDFLFDLKNYMKKLTFTLSLIFVFFLGKNFAAVEDLNCSYELYEQNGSCLIVHASAGVGPFTYLWDDGSTASYYCPDPITTDSICVVITDYNGCSATLCGALDTTTVVSDCNVFIFDTSQPNAPEIKAGKSGIWPFTYLWSTGETTESIIPQEGENYCVTMTDSEGCSSTDCYTYYYPGNSCNALLYTYQNGECAQVEPIGTGPFSYLWSDGSTSGYVCNENAPADTFCVEITDGYGCVSTACAVLGVPTNTCSVTLNASQNGMCLVAYPQGTAPFTYQWSNGSTETSACNNNPFTDSLCVTITDATGCTATACGTVSGNSNICQVEIDANYTTTSAQLTAIAQGTAPFSYYWDTGQNTQSISAPLSGDYCVTVVDATNCAEAYCLQVTINTTCSVSVSTIQNGACLQAQPQGVAPFTYVWDDASMGMTYCSNTPGIDSVCVVMTDANGCVATACGVIDNGTTCTAEIVDSTLAGGYYLLAFSNGTAPFTYNWSTGETTEYIAPTTSGNYCVSIVDNNNCVATVCEMIQITSTTCNVEIQDSSGMFYWLIAEAEGTAPFTYTWSTGENTYYSIPQSSGTYCVTVVDANNCETTECMEVTLPIDCSVVLSTFQNGVCLQANPQGVAPFTYQWSDGSTGTNYCSNVQGIDTVCVVLTDANGCTSTACGVIDNGGTVNCNVNVYPSFSGNGVSLIANTTGVAPFTYNWSNGQTTPSITPSSTGTFQVTITDAFGCVSSSSYTLNCTTTSPNNGITVMIDYDSTTTGGTIFIASAAGGYGNYSYLWSTGETTVSIVASLGQQLSVTVTDGLGCSVTEAVYTCSTPTLELALDNNEIFAHATGGVAPYSYSWSTGELAESITVPSLSNTYCVTVTDADGCTADGCLSVNFNNDIYGSLMLNPNTTPSTTLYEAIVYLIEYDPVAETLTAVDSAEFSSTLDSLNSIQFYFQGVPEGDYLVKAALLPGSQGFADYLPTYYGDVLFWDDATNVSIPQNNFIFLPVNMIQGNNPGGPGFIGGLVSEGANLQASGSVETRDEGDPVANVSVLLLTANDEPVTHTLTDADGKFEFPNIAWGTYKVMVEMIGLDQGEKQLTIDPNTPTANVEFDVNESFVTKTDELWNGGTLNIFPNPTKSQMTVEVDLKNKSNIQINVVNLLGKTIISRNENMGVGINTLSLDLSRLPSGVYFLNLTDGSGMVTRRIVKE